MNLLFVALIVLFAAALQTMAGFGFALTVMPLLTILVGLRTAAPLVALAGFTLYAINLFRHRQAIDRQEIVRLGAASVLGVPIGVWALGAVDEALIRPALGALLIAYALYALLAAPQRMNSRPSRLASPLWGYPAGFLAGCLSGAYNTPGPPIILYGALRQWPRDQFRSMLQALFLGNSALVIGAHVVAGNVAPDIIAAYLAAAPALLLGILIGARIDHKLDARRFRTLVTVMILALGLALIFLP